jgi:hypothetical protein
LSCGFTETTAIDLPSGRSVMRARFGAFVAEIAFWNTIQGTIDVYVSWIISIAVLRRIPSLVKK